MPPSEQQIFFTLLRASIFQRPADLSLFSLPDWTWAPICRSLESHSLLALAADAIIPINDQLPSSKQLTPIQLMAIYKHSATVAQTHFELNQAVADIFEHLKDFNPILLKGQGLSTIYPNQNTRSCGDIVIYI